MTLSIKEKQRKQHEKTVDQLNYVAHYLELYLKHKNSDRADSEMFNLYRSKFSSKKAVHEWRQRLGWSVSRGGKSRNVISSFYLPHMVTKLKLTADSSRQEIQSKLMVDLHVDQQKSYASNVSPTNPAINIAKVALLYGTVDKAKEALHKHKLLVQLVVQSGGILQTELAFEKLAEEIK